MDDDASPSAFALEFGERRLKEALDALQKLSPALAAEVRGESGKGPLFDRMKHASASIGKISVQINSGGKVPKRIISELELSLGKSYTKTNANAILRAHSDGLAHLATVEGLGGVIFLHFASRFRQHVQEYAKTKKIDEAILVSAIALVDSWVRELLTKHSPNDPDDPIRALAFSEDEEDAERWTGELIMRCIPHAENDEVSQLIRGSFRDISSKR